MKYGVLIVVVNIFVGILIGKKNVWLIKFVVVIKIVLISVDSGIKVLNEEFISFWVICGVSNFIKLILLVNVMVFFVKVVFISNSVNWFFWMWFLMLVVIFLFNFWIFKFWIIKIVIIISFIVIGISMEILV